MDSELRLLEREVAAGGGDPAAEARLVNARIRAGELTLAGVGEEWVRGLHAEDRLKVAAAWSGGEGLSDSGRPLVDSSVTPWPMCEMARALRWHLARLELNEGVWLDVADGAGREAKRIAATEWCERERIFAAIRVLGGREPVRRVLGTKRMPRGTRAQELQVYEWWWLAWEWTGPDNSRSKGWTVGLVAEVNAAIEGGAWSREVVGESGLVGYEAQSNGWRLLLAAVGEHLDGTATKEGVIMHMTFEQRRRSYALARETRGGEA